MPIPDPEVARSRRREAIDPKALEGTFGGFLSDREDSQ